MPLTELTCFDNTHLSRSKQAIYCFQFYKVPISEICGLYPQTTFTLGVGTISLNSNSALLIAEIH